MSDFCCARSSVGQISGEIAGTTIFGVDFSSAPSMRKPITVARGRLVLDQSQGVLFELLGFVGLPDLVAFEAFLSTSGPWIGGFDFPFGLPREFVETVGWPRRWPELVAYFESLPRERARELFRAFCAARPAGHKFAHRATDRPAGSSASMKWVNPPVAWMFQAGAPRLMRAGVHIPGLWEGDRGRVALEAYPGLLARSVTRQSYKSDDPRRQDPSRGRAREQILEALLSGRHRLELPIRCAPEAATRLADDPRGDWLDAVLCAVQAAWALAREPGYGLPEAMDDLEGWIVGC
jgi:hypothetical protein